MKPVKRWRASRPVLARLGLLVVALAMVGGSSAHADIFRLGYDDAGADPAADFDADCLGDTPADDCDTRAALLEADLVSVLSKLEDDTDPKTLPLFQAALDVDSPFVHAMAVRYLARTADQPNDFLSKVKTFFFGPDAALGVSSAEVLGSSADRADQDLAKLYAEERSASDYGPQPLSDDPDDAEKDPLLLACTKDARLDLMTSFAADEQFAPAYRLLAYDRFVFSTSEAMQDYPVTSFLTDSSVEEVSAFFNKLFGKSYGPLADGITRVQELTSELATLQAAAAGGDQTAIAKLTKLVTELTEAQQVLTLGGLLQLTTIHAENDLVWVDGDVDELGSKPTRAVTVGEDALLGRTVIRYINAPAGQPGGAAGGDSGSGGEQAVPRGDAGASADEGGAAKKSDSGCGCAVPGAPSHSAWLSALSLLAFLGLRDRRRERKH